MIGKGGKRREAPRSHTHTHTHTTHEDKWEHVCGSEIGKEREREKEEYLWYEGGRER